MKEKIIKTAKIVLIVFGVLFLIQILLFVIVLISINSLSRFDNLQKIDFSSKQFSNKPKEMTPIIDYVEDYQIKNNKYPEKLEGVKIKKNLDYKYETSKDGNCYSITINKKGRVQEYQHCKSNSNDSSSTSESYVEYSNNER